MKRVSIIGDRYGRLLVVDFSGVQKGKSVWKCQCDCGSTVNVVSNSLRRGVTKSCGCARAESARINGTKSHGPVVHGFAANRGTPEYHVWRSMRARCSPSARGNDRIHYFERGIRVCERWNDFMAFIEDMGRRPSPAHSIDRIDNDRGYEPGNCRWATAIEQANNRRPRSCRKIGSVGGLP